MNSEIEKSPREIAEAFVEKWENYANSIDAVEQLLISRDERAAKIADAEHARLYPGVDYGDESDSSAFRIASAIRGSK
jgi:hypothetical protein